MSTVTFSSHVVVFWEKEKSFSTVSIKKVDKGEIPEAAMEGQEFRIKWNKKFKTGKIMGSGTKSEMFKLEGFLAQEAADLSFNEDDLHQSLHLADRKKRASKNPYGAEFVDISLGGSPKKLCTQQELESAPSSQDGLLMLSGVSQLENPVQDNGIMQDVEILHEKENTIAAMSAEIYKLKKQNRKLTKMAKSCDRLNVSAVDGKENRVDIGSGVTLDSSFVELAKLSHSYKPSLFLRKLVFNGEVYDLKEIANSSFSGKASPMFPNIKRNPLNPAKFGALKAFTILTCGLQPRTAQMFDFEQKIKNIPGDARKKLKNKD